MKMRDVAKKYAEKGFYVLPMDHKSKRPLIKFKNQPALTAEEIDKYWDEFPKAQIALRTVGFIVVDIDIHDGVNGFESLKKYKNISKFPETLTQTTGSGGRQMFFTKPKGYDIKQIIGWLEGVDIKAHKNNYVMVAPSHIEGKPNAYKWDNRNPMAVLPKEIADDMVKKTAATKSSYSLDSIGKKTATTYLFESIVRGFETGKRNDSLATFVGGLLIRNVDVEDVLELAHLANSRSAEPLEETEFNKTFESVLESEIARRQDLERRAEQVERINNNVKINATKASGRTVEPGGK